jgi:hypothetical protein
VPGSEIEDFGPVHKRKDQQHRTPVAALRGPIPVKTRLPVRPNEVLWGRVSARNPCRQQDVRGLDRSCEGPRLQRGVVIRARKRRALPGPRRGLIHQRTGLGHHGGMYM